MIKRTTLFLLPTENKFFFFFSTIGMECRFAPIMYQFLFPKTKKTETEKVLSVLLGLGSHPFQIPPTWGI